MYFWFPHELRSLEFPHIPSTLRGVSGILRNIKICPVYDIILQKSNT